MRLCFALLLFSFCSACASIDHRIVDARTHASVDPEVFADGLVQADVVFLGEVHSSDVAHRLQAETLQRLVARRPGLVLSLEMFERDVQPLLDDYLAGRIDEAAFLAKGRPWKGYDEHYRALIEIARGHGLPVVAANLPRATAGTIAEQGLEAARDAAYMPDEVWLDTPEYRARFEAAMAEHADVADVDHYFAAQSAKDDAMAESIARVFDAADAAGRPLPFVVHVCGNFHSDYRHGTVERLLRRRPDLSVAVVTTVETRAIDRALDTQEAARADWVWLVRPTKAP